MEKTLKTTLYYDSSKESDQAKKILDAYQIHYRGIFNSPGSYSYLPFIFTEKKHFKLKGLVEIENFAEEDFETNIKFLKNDNYIESIKELWMLESLFGKIEVRKFIIENNREISKTIIEKLFQKYPLTFYIDDKKSILASTNSELLAIHYGKFSEISGSDALKYFKIQEIEEAKEKGYAKR
jgi:hypothetical protein